MAATVLEAAAALPVMVLAPRGVLVIEGSRTGRLYILKSGNLEVVRNGTVVAGIGNPGAIVGEMSVLLGQPHSATVRSRYGAEVHVVDDPIAFMDQHPPVAREIAQALAIRLKKTTELLVDMRRETKARQDHEMFDKIFDLLK